MEKISLNKKDSVPQIVEKILESEDENIILSVPADSLLERKVSDFELIKREAEAAGKKISVVSADEEIEDLARKAGILITESRSGKSRQVMSDIVLSRRCGKSKSGGAERAKEEKKEIETENHGYKTSFWEKAEEESDSKRKFGEEMSERLPKEEKKEEKKEKKRRPGLRSVKIAVWTIAVFALAIFSSWAYGRFLGKAEISMVFKKTPWQYGGTVTAGKTFSKTDVAKGYLPAEIFKQQKNETRLFPASGVAQVSYKAAAKIVVYNSYSSSKQTLVAATRFSAPDGKIFRLDGQVVVPGAVVKDGKITPSSVEASVTADKAGADYNVGPFDKLTIPGFKGTPRYDGFYASMPQAASGGFVGTKKIPTDGDISSAKEKTSQNLKDSFQNVFLGGIPEGFNILPGASLVNITKLNVNKTTDDGGNFSVFGEASYQAVGFKDDDMKFLLNSLSLKNYPDMNLEDLKLTYSNVKVDTLAGQVVFSVSASGTLKPKFSEDDLKAKIAGKSFSDAKSAISALQYLDSAKVSLWPFWINDIPKNTGRIKVLWN